MIKIDVQSTRAEIRSQKPLTVGLRGAKARFSFSKDWENLIKTAVFRQGEKTVTVADIGQEVTIPCEVLTAPGVPVQIGVYGIDSTETIAIPTLWAVTKPVRPGTDPEGDPSTEPTPGLWEQMQGKLGSLEQLDTDDKSSLVAAVNEANRAVCLVTVTDNGDGSYNADKTVLQLMAAQSDGKMLICRLGSLWMHLTDAHNGPTFEFTTVKKNTKCCVTISGDGSVKYSTETLATAQSKLPNPKKLTFVGAATAEYDGSEELEVEIPTKAPVTSVNGQTGTVNLSVPLRVTVEELENGVTQSDPPYEELAELRNEGHLLYCQHGSLELPLVAVTPFMYIFSCVQGGKVHSVMIGSSSVTVTATPLASGGGTDGITPHIGTNGNWFIGDTDTGMPSRGEAGTDGKDGTDGQDGKDGSPGTDGNDGVSPTIAVSKSGKVTTITITDKSGTKIATINDGSDGAPGKDGSNGADGHTPVKGVDYWTDADQEAIVQQVITALGTPVFGRVDADNNIILTGELANGTYTLKYEDAEGETVEVGRLEVGATGYTNLANPSSADWLTDIRLSSSGAETASAGAYTTNYIALKQGDVVRIRGLNIYYNAGTGTGYATTWFFDESKTGIAKITPAQNAAAFGGVSHTDPDKDFVYTVATNAEAVSGSASDIRYARFVGRLCAGCTVDDIIITVNQEITE